MQMYKRKFTLLIQVSFELKLAKSFAMKKYLTILGILFLSAVMLMADEKQKQLGEKPGSYE
jgi:hypothetical protein